MVAVTEWLDILSLVLPLSRLREVDQSEESWLFRGGLKETGAKKACFRQDELRGGIKGKYKINKDVFEP